jgi:hypothetical protein
MAKKVKDSRLDYDSPDYEPRMDPDNAEYDPNYDPENVDPGVGTAGKRDDTAGLTEEEEKEDKERREKEEREARAEEKARADLEAAEREGKIKAQAEIDADKERVNGPPIRTAARRLSNAELDADGEMKGSPVDDNRTQTGTEGASATNPKLVANEVLSTGEPNPEFEKALKQPISTA